MSDFVIARKPDAVAIICDHAWCMGDERVVQGMLEDGWQIT
jgi:hypothetical protein